MKLRLIGAILVGAAVAAWACKGDPTADLRNGAAALSVTPSIVVVDPGTVVAVTVEVQDAQLNPLIGDVTASTSDATLATVEVDASRHFPDASTHAFNVTAVGVNGGQPLITFSTGSVDTALVVNLNPVEFNGTISSATPKGGSIITISSTSVLKLDEVTGVTFGGTAGTIASQSKNALAVVVPFSSAGKPKLSSVYTTYMGSDFTFNLPSASVVTQTGDLWDGDSTAATAPALVMPDIATKGSVQPMITNLYAGDNHTACPEPTAQGPCMYYGFALTDTATLTFATTWDGSPADSTRIVTFACASPFSAVTCSATAFEAADTVTKKRPKSVKFKFPAGNHLFIIERRNTAATTPTPPGPTTPPKNIRVTITRN